MPNDNLRSEKATPPSPRRRERRYRYRLDALTLAVLDNQIAKAAAHGRMLPLSRPQMLFDLVVRARCCQCDAQDRDLPPIEVPKNAPRFTGVDATDLVRGAVLAEEMKTRNRVQKLHRRALLRELIMRGARCVCPSSLVDKALKE